MNHIHWCNISVSVYLKYDSSTFKLHFGNTRIIIIYWFDELCYFAILCITKLNPLDFYSKQTINVGYMIGKKRIWFISQVSGVSFFKQNAPLLIIQVTQNWQLCEILCIAKAEQPLKAIQTYFARILSSNNTPINTSSHIE